MSHEILSAYFQKYVSFTPTELALIHDHYHEKTVEKGKFILRKGEICRFEGFVVSGCFKVFVADRRGVEKILYFAAEEWWVMENNSFDNQIASDLNIQALEDSQLLTISKTDKEALYQKIPKVEQLFRIMSQKAVVAWQRRLVRNHTMNAEERYLYFIHTYPDIASRVTNKQIASYLGITHEFVSKIRRKLSKQKS